jgi:hypothetical protein
LPQYLEYTSIFSSCEVTMHIQKLNPQQNQIALWKTFFGQMIAPQMSWDILIAVILRRSRLFWSINSPHPASSLNNTKQDILPWFVYIYICMTLVSGSRALGRILNRSILQEESGSHENFTVKFDSHCMTLYRSHDRWHDWLIRCDSPPFIGITLFTSRCIINLYKLNI